MTCQLYRHYDNSGLLLYVGESLNALNRLAQHRDCSHWFQSIARVDVKHFPDKTAALLAERAAIIEENPLYNIKRPKLPPIKPPHVVAAEAARKALVRTVVFRPLYDRADVAHELGVSESKVESIWDAGALGYVVVGTRRGKHQRPLRMTTGWQLISYVESLPHTEAKK